MRTVYAIQFSLDPTNEYDSAEVLEDIRSETRSWIEASYYRRWGRKVDLEFPCSEWSPMDHHSIATSVQNDGPQDLTTLDWAHLDQEDPNLVWHTEAVFARDSEDIDVSVRVRITSPRFELLPVPDYFVGRPRFVTDILRRFPCRVGEQLIPAAPRHVGVGDVEDFVNRVLENADRRLPVVLLSQDNWTQQPYISPGDLLERTLGHAVVAEIDKHAGFDLTGLVGRRLSCWGGAIRLYWPGFRRDSQRFHPLYLPDRMDYHAERGRPIQDHLFSQLSAIAILRHTEGETVRTVRRHFRTQRQSELMSLRAGLEEKERGEQELEQVEERLLQALVEIDELEAENTRLERDLEAAHENLTEVARQIGVGDEGKDEATEAEAEPFQPESVLEAILEADSRYNGPLQIWETAYESAEQSDFARPEEVFDALTALHDLSIIYFRSLDAEEPMGPWDNFFADRGLKYKPSEHQTTITKYGDQRTFTRGDESRLMQRHITLGGGSRRDCVQIFFEEDRDQRTIHIGYCGRHLDFANQRT